MIRRFALAAGLAAALCASAAQAAVVQTNANPSGLPPMTAALTSPTCTAAFTPIAGRAFNVSGWGAFVGTAVLERSFDAGVTKLPITAAGTALYSWTAPFSETAEEAEAGVAYYLCVTAYTSGPINLRISQ